MYRHVILNVGDLISLYCLICLDFLTDVHQIVSIGNSFSVDMKWVGCGGAHTPDALYICQGIAWYIFLESIKFCDAVVSGVCIF